MLFGCAWMEQPMTLGASRAGRPYPSELRLKALNTRNHGMSKWLDSEHETKWDVRYVLNVKMESTVTGRRTPEELLENDGWRYDWRVRL